MIPRSSSNAQPFEQENAFSDPPSNSSSNKRPRAERAAQQVNSLAEREIQNLDLPPVEDIYYEAICTRKRRDEGKHVVLESVRVVKKIPGAASREDAEAGGYLTSRNGSYDRLNDVNNQVAIWPDHTERSFQKRVSRYSGWCCIRQADFLHHTDLRRILPMGKIKVKATVRHVKDEEGSKYDTKRSEKKREAKDKRRRTQEGHDYYQVPGELVEKMSGRNELIARLIERDTGVIYSRKQVSSHLQVLRGKMNRPMDNLFTDSTGKPAKQDEIAVIYQEWKTKYGALHFNEADGVLEPLKSNKELPDKLESKPLLPPTPLALLLPANRSSQICSRRSEFQFVEVQCGVYATPERSSKRIIHHYTSTLNSSAADTVGLTKIPDPSTFYPNLCLSTTRGFAEQIILCEASLALNSDIAQPGRYVGVTMVASFYCGVKWPEWWVTGAGYLSCGRKVVSEERKCRVSQLGTDSFSLSLHVSTCFLTMLLTDCARAESKISREDISPEATAARRASIRPIIEAASYVQELYADGKGQCAPRRVAVFLWKFCEVSEGTIASWTWKQVVYGQDPPELAGLRAEGQDDLPCQNVMKRPMWKTESGQSHIGFSVSTASRKPPLKSPLARGYRHRPWAPWPRIPSRRLEDTSVSEHPALPAKDIQITACSLPFIANKQLNPAERFPPAADNKFISPLEFISQYPGERVLEIGCSKAPGLLPENDNWMNNCQMMDDHQNTGSLAIDSESVDLHQDNSFPPAVRRGTSASQLQKISSQSGSNDLAVPFNNSAFSSIAVDDFLKVSSNRYGLLNSEPLVFAPVSPSRVVHSSPEERRKCPLEPPCPSPTLLSNRRSESTASFPDETASHANSSTDEGDALVCNRSSKGLESLDNASRELVGKPSIYMIETPESIKAESFEVLDFSQQDIDNVLREYDLLPTTSCSTIANPYLDSTSLDSCSLSLPADRPDLSYEVDLNGDDNNALPPGGSIDEALHENNHDAQHLVASEGYESEKAMGPSSELDCHPQQQPDSISASNSTSREVTGKESGRPELSNELVCELSDINNDASLFSTMPENWERLIAYVAGPQVVLGNQSDEADQGLEPYQSQEWVEVDTSGDHADAQLMTHQGMVLGEIGEDNFDKYSVGGGGVE